MNPGNASMGETPLKPDALQLESLSDHRGAMAFIDELVEAGTNGARCRAVIRSDNPFLVDGRLPGWILIEYIAQSVAIFAGHRRASEDSEHRHGLLLGCRNLRISREAIDIGSRLDIEIEEFARFDRLGSFNGRVFCEESVAANGILSVYEAAEWPEPGMSPG